MNSMLDLLDQFFGRGFAVLSQTETGLHLRNNATGDILFLGADIGHDLETGADAAWLELQLNGRGLPDTECDTNNNLPPPWKLWQEDDDPQGIYYTLRFWPLTLSIDPHKEEVLVQIVDLDRPVARRFGFNDLAEARRLALELAAGVLADWQVNIRQALLHEAAAPSDEPEMTAWHFEQYGDTDDPTEGYYTRHIGPFQLAVEPNGPDAVVDIFDPDLMLLRTGLTSLAEAQRVAVDLMANVLTGWQNELRELKDRHDGHIKKSDGLPAIYRGETHRALSAKYPAIEPGDAGVVRPAHKWDIAKEPLQFWRFYPAKWGYIYCIPVANNQVETPDQSNICKSRFALTRMGFQTTYVVAGRKDGAFMIIDAHPRPLRYGTPKTAALPLCFSRTRQTYPAFDAALAAIVADLTNGQY